MFTEFVKWFIYSELHRILPAGSLRVQQMLSKEERLRILLESACYRLAVNIRYSHRHQKALRSDDEWIRSGWEVKCHTRSPGRAKLCFSQNAA